VFNWPSAQASAASAPQSNVLKGPWPVSHVGVCVIDCPSLGRTSVVTPSPGGRYRSVQANVAHRSESFR